MSDLGWTKKKVKWGKVDYARALWVRPGFNVENGKLFGPDGYQLGLTEHLAQFTGTVEV